METYCFHTLRRPVTKVCFVSFNIRGFFLVQFQFQFCLLTEQFFPKMFCVPFWFYSYSATIYVADIRSRRRLQRINHILKIFCLESGKEIMPIWTLIQALCLLHTNNNKTYHYINRMKAGVMKKIIMMMMKWLYQDSHYLHW
jgi:hypothetical protein